MSLTALACVLAAAALHAGWNYVLKGVDKLSAKEIVCWWALAAGAVAGLPALFVFGPVPTKVLPFALASGFAQLAYFMALARAYERGDLSLVYPIARGLAPLLIAFWAWALLHETPATGGLLGLLLVMVGLLTVLGAGMKGGSGIGHALAVALSISIYSTIDGAAVRQAPPLAYAVLIFAVPAVLMAPVVIGRHGRREVLAVGRAEARRVAIVGVLMAGAYALALQAYSMAPLAYVGALREVGVVFAAIAGWRLLGEPFGVWRCVGAFLIFLGAVAIAVFG